MSSIVSRALLASLGAAALISAVPAAAGTVEQVSSEVRYGDLDLKSEAGVAQLKQRIRTAARKVCGGQVELRDIRARQAADRCLAAALAGAAPKIELAVANARTGQNLAANAALQVGEPHTR